MGSSLNLSLTDELRAFVDANSGDGTDYATPSEFVRDVLRERKERIEAARIRDAILEGYRDAGEGRTVRYRGDLRHLLKKANEFAQAAIANCTCRALRAGRV
jgi:antitoxin ParD1/3/4